MTIAAGGRSENVSEITADTKVSEEGGGRGAPGTRAEISLQPMMNTMVRQAVPLQPMEVHGGADIHLQPVEDPMLEQVDLPEVGYDPVESPCWSRLLLGPVDSDPVESPRWSSLFLKDCTPWKGPMLEQFMEDYLL